MDADHIVRVQQLAGQEHLGAIGEQAVLAEQRIEGIDIGNAFRQRGLALAADHQHQRHGEDHRVAAAVRTLGGIAQRVPQLTVDLLRGHHRQRNGQR
ncbi:hypothetical protein D3C84_1048910 [compost metagenome]